MEASPQARYLGHWVKVINHDTTVKMNRLLKPFGLTRSSWSVLYQVNGAGRISQKALQEDLGIESGSMAIVVDGLVRKGWLDRTSSEKDRRANYLKLTPKGSARWKTIPDIGTAHAQGNDAGSHRRGGERSGSDSEEVLGQPSKTTANNSIPA